MSLAVQLLLSAGVLGTFGGVVRLIFMFGATYERITNIEKRLDLIDRDGCRRICVPGEH